MAKVELIDIFGTGINRFEARKQALELLNERLALKPSFDPTAVICAHVSEVVARGADDPYASEIAIKHRSGYRIDIFYLSDSMEAQK